MNSCGKAHAEVGMLDSAFASPFQIPPPEPAASIASRGSTLGLAKESAVGAEAGDSMEDTELVAL